MSQKLKLVRRILTLLVLVALVVFLFRWCNKKSNTNEFVIDNTPIKVEMVRNIAEIATVSFKDEVVVDSVEYYANTQEQIAGNLMKLTDPDDFKYGIRSSAIKRRLTMIVRGELRVGFDLKKHPVKIETRDSVVYIQLPEPKVLDVLVTPKTTEIYLENGEWKDFEITRLQNRSRKKLAYSAQLLKLDELAKRNMESLFRKLISDPTQKIEFEYK